MEMKMLGVAALALSLCGTGAMAHAQSDEAPAPPPQHWGGHGPGMGGPEMGMGYFGFMSRELNLTNAQKQQIHGMMEAQRAATKPLMQQLEQNRAAMLTATAGGAFDAAKVQALATQRAQISVQLDVQREKLQSQIYNTVLTQDQKATAEQLRQKQLARINQHLHAAADAAPEAE
jgi:Spy/CpxP family protein refolding chaperone